MAIVEDSSTPSVKSGADVSSLTTSSFTPPDGSVVVALAVGAYGYGSGTSISISDSDDGSTGWSTAGSQDAPSSADQGACYIFYKKYPTSPGSITVSANYQSSNGSTLLAVRVLTGCDDSALGATAGDVKTGGPSTLTQEITPSSAGSKIYGAAFNNYSSDGSAHANSDTTGIAFYSKYQSWSWVFSRDQLSPDTSSVTLGCTGMNGQDAAGIQLAEFIPTQSMSAAADLSVPSATAAGAASVTASGALAAQPAPGAAELGVTVTDEATTQALAGVVTASASAHVWGGVADAKAPACSATAAGELTVSGTASSVRAPALSTSLDALEDLFGTLTATAPAAAAAGGAETRVEGERIVRVPPEDRTLKIPEDRPPGLFYV